MKMEAAVCRECNKPITIEEVESASPKEEEVLIKTMHTCLYHSDFSPVAGWRGIVRPIGPVKTQVLVTVRNCFQEPLRPT
jgi:Zn-dependent alcohol dehydrogenase